MRLRDLVLTALLILCAAPASAEEEGPAPAQRGRDWEKYDFDQFFTPGDEWKKTKQVFVWNNDAEPQTLDPAVMTGVTEHNLALCLFEGLTTLHPATCDAIPGIASWWEISADGLVYTFHLRKEAKWSNGDPVTAEDFRWSWQRALTPDTESKYTEMFHAIRGAEAYYSACVAGSKPDFKTVGVEALDAHTLRVTLHAPTPYFLEIAAFETLMPVHRATVEKHGKTEWTKPGNIVSNGPFAMEVWKPRERIELVPNPHWWNRRIVRLERTIVKPIDDLSTQFAEYLSGGVDWVRQIGASKVDEAQAHPDYYVAPYLGVFFFRMNVEKKPFDDVRVRQALNAAIDKKAICETVLKAGQAPAMGVVALGIRGYPELEGHPYDPKRARDLLAQAGYPEGKGFPDVELLFNNNESHKQVCEQMVEMWKTVLGVKVQLKNVEWQVYLKDTHEERYQISRAGWIADYADPSTFLDLWVTDRGNNNTNWSNAKYDELLAKSVRELDPVRRFALLAEAERIVCVDEMPILPLYYYVNQGMIRPRVKGWSENKRDLHPLQYVWLEGPPVSGK